MTESPSSSDRVWALIENEKRRDRFIRRVSIAAWSMTFALVLLVGIMVGVQMFEIARAVQVGAVPKTALIGSAMPLVDVLWKLSLLVATLSTIGIFLRLRTASLTEIQLRLATLESILGAQSDGGGGEGRAS